jgi:hypothetical protein
MGPHDVAFPNPSEIAPHAIAFARMVFAHAAFEREVRSLVGAINPKKPGFGERPENQWTASESGTGKIIILIRHHRGSGLPQIVNRAYTVSDILKLAHKFKDIEAELYKIRRSLEPKMSEAEMRAASSFLRAS